GPAGCARCECRAAATTPPVCSARRAHAATQTARRCRCASPRGARSPGTSLEDGKRELLLRRRQRLAGQQVAAREVGDGERIAVAPIAELELAFVVGTPEGIRLRRARERSAGGRGPAAAAPLDQAVAVEHRVDRTDRRQLHTRGLLPELLPDLRRAPARVLALQP